MAIWIVLYLPFLRWIQHATWVPQASGPANPLRTKSQWTQLPVETASGPLANSADEYKEMAHVVNSTRESVPRTLDGILDMIGPRTLEGGYSPSQYVSSAYKAVESLDTNAGGVRICAAGTKACDTATRSATTMYVNLGMIDGLIRGIARRKS